MRCVRTDMNANPASRRARLLAASLPVIAALAAGPSWSEAVRKPGRILGLRVREDATLCVVEVLADRPLSFTTLRLSSPSRVVLDFADGELVSAPPEIEVQDGTVRRVGAAVAGTRTARVVIELAGETEFDVRAVGTRLEVRVTRLAPLLAASRPAANDRSPEQGPPGEVPPSAGGPPPDGPLAPAGAPAPAGDPAALAAERAAALEREKRASLPTVSIAGPGRDEPRSDDVPSEPAQAQEAALDPAARAGPSEQAPAQGPGALADRRPPRPASISGVGFRPLGEGVVIVRSNRPVDFTVTSRDREVLLHLPRATIPAANNRRPLDTRVFGGPVEQIVPILSSAGAELRIDLREKTAFQVEQSGGLLTVTFTR